MVTCNRTSEAQGKCVICGATINFKVRGKNTNKYYFVEVCSPKCRGKRNYQKGGQIQRARLKQRYHDNPQPFRQWQKDYSIKKWAEATRIFGRACYFCGREKTQNSRLKQMLDFHNKKGNNHDNQNGYRLAVKYPQDYIPVCPWCHKGVHFAMRRLGLKWEEIDALFKERGVKHLESGNSSTEKS